MCCRHPGRCPHQLQESRSSPEPAQGGADLGLVIHHHEIIWEEAKVLGPQQPYAPTSRIFLFLPNMIFL